MDRAWGLIVASAVLGIAGDARTDKFDETLDVSLHARTSWFQAKGAGLGLAPAYDAPVLEAADPQLVGTGRGYAASLRANLSIDGFPFGLGTGFITSTGLELESTDPLEPGRVWGLPLEAFVGFAFDSGGPSGPSSRCAEPSPPCR